MDTKKIVSFIVLLGGEAIIIAAFILFRGSLAPDVLVLNIVVSSVIYGLFFLDILVPWINLNDKQGKKVLHVAMSPQPRSGWRGGLRPPGGPGSGPFS